MEENRQIQMPSWQVHWTNLHADPAFGWTAVAWGFHGSASWAGKGLPGQHEENRGHSQEQFYHQHIKQPDQIIKKTQNLIKQRAIRTFQIISKVNQAPKMENRGILNTWLNLDRQADYSLKADPFIDIKEVNLNETKLQMILIKGISLTLL